MRVRVLGDLEVAVAGGPVDLGGPKPRALLSLLVAADARPVPVEQLVDQMWGEDPPARVEASLQSYVARLRRVLEPERDARGPARRLRTHAGAYSFDVDADAVDSRTFAALVRQGRSLAADDPAGAAAVLTEALALWRGEPYLGFDSPSLRAEATRLEELRVGATGDLLELRLERGEHAAAVAELEQLVRRHPLDERFWELLALALYRTRRQGDALAALRRARETLADELGVDPGPQLRRLEERILRQDPGLDAPSGTPAPHGSPAPPPPSPQPSAPPPPSAGQVPPPVLPGRAQALAELREVLAAAGGGRGRVVLVLGEPGIGKTRLAGAVADEAQRSGFRVGRGGWDTDVDPPLRGWAQALTEAWTGPLGREVLGADRGGADAASVSLRQAEAVVAAAREAAPTLLVLDDVQWADTESLRLLRRVAGEVARVPLVVVVTARTAPADLGDPLADLLADLARLGCLRLELSGLPPEAVAAWVAAHAGREVTEEVAAELVRRTDGNPFYLTEVVRLLVSEGALGEPGSAAWRAVPGGVRDVVRQRLRSLPEPAAALLRTAAVVGRELEVAVLEALVGETAPGGGTPADEVAEALESAQVLGLVDEAGPGRYRFAHALVRDAVYESISAPARARRHAEVAAAVETVHAGRVDEHAAVLAEHYRLAGPAHARSGWVFARRAAEAARTRSEYDEALRLDLLAGELQGLDPTADAREREGVLVATARGMGLVGRPIESWAPARAACLSALDRGDPAAAATALLTVTEGSVWGWRTHPHHDEDATALWARTRDLQRAEDTLTRARLTAALATEHLLLPHAGAGEESTRLADEAVAAVRRSGRKGADELVTLRLAHSALLRPALLHHRMPLSDEIVGLAAAVGQPHDLATALTARAQDRGELGRLADAHSDVVRAHELAEQHHLSQNRMVTQWCLSLRRTLEGRWSEAERLIEENDAFQATLAMSGRGIGACQLAMLRDLQGRLPELESVLREHRSVHPAIREIHALAMVRAGRLDELRTLLGPWSEQPALLQDYLWLFLSAVRAEVWVALGDLRAAADLTAALTPYADRLAMSLAVWFRGSVRLTLGRLAATLGEAEQARAHLRAARRVHDELGLDLWTEVADAELARL